MLSGFLDSCELILRPLFCQMGEVLFDLYHMLLHVAGCIGGRFSLQGIEYLLVIAQRHHASFLALKLIDATLSQHVMNGVINIKQYPIACGANKKPVKLFVVRSPVPAAGHGLSLHV